MYQVELRRKAQRDLEKLPKKDFETAIKAIKGLSANPRPKGVEKIKIAGLWRIRQGDYRIVYNIDDNQKVIIILRIGHRREIYRSL
jgi:mRNA interferase RelE/StbE